MVEGGGGRGRGWGCLFFFTKLSILACIIALFVKFLLFGKCAL